MGTGGSFPGGKARPGRDADHSPPSSAEVKNEYELYLLSPNVPPWRVAGQLYFFFYVQMDNYSDYHPTKISCRYISFFIYFYDSLGIIVKSGFKRIIVSEVEVYKYLLVYLSQV
jgi:hypothetical protein